MAFPLQRKITWEPNPDPAGGVPESYEVSMNGTIVATTQATAPTEIVVTHPKADVYKAEVVAINAFGRSAPAPAIDIALPPGTPISVHFTAA